MKKKRHQIKNSGYSESGASTTKPTLREYLPKSFSPLSDIEQNLSILRNRSMDLAINPMGAAAINTMLTGTIGAGLKLFPQIKYKELGLTSEQAREWARKTKLEFSLWADSLDCDYLRRNNFFELQRILFYEMLSAGDSFVLFKRRFSKGNPYTLRLQIVPAQRVSNPITNGGLSFSQVEMKLPNGNRCVNGIEIDTQGKMIAIHISNRVWNEPVTSQENLSWQRVKIFGDKTGCRNVLQVAYDTRADSFRGVPFLSPVIETLKQVSRYCDAELTASIVKSFFSLFFTQPISNFEINDILPNEEKPVVDVREYKLGSGTLSALPRGVDVKAVSRTDGASSFEPFVSHFVKQIASALNLPYELIVKQFNSSFSASKAALIEAEKEFRQRRAAFVNDMLQPVYENFLMEAVALGRIDAPGFFDDPLKRYCWSAADWRNEQNHSLDPVKEVQGAILKINAGLSTREAEVAALNGSDFYENIEQLEMENALFRKARNRIQDTESVS